LGVAKLCRTVCKALLANPPAALALLKLINSVPRENPQALAVG